MDPNVRRLGLGGLVRATGMSLILPYFALYLRNVLRLGYAEIGLLAVLTGVVPLAVVPIAGLITDRWGRRRIFLLALSAEAGAMLLCGGAMSVRSLPLLLFGVSTVQTVGTIGGPALSAYVADLAQGADRTVGFTWLRVGWNVGFTTGVLAGGVLIGFVGFVAVGLLAGTVLLGSTALLAAILSPSPYDLALRAAAPGGAAERRPRPSSVRESFGVLARDRPFLALCGTTALAMLTVSQWGVTFPVYVNTVLHLPYAILGLGLALNGVLVVFGQPPTTRLALGRRHSALLAFGVLLYAAGFLLLGLAGVVGAGLLALFFGVVVVLTMGENVTSIPTSTLPSNLAPPAEIGAYNGAFTAVVGLGQVLAPALGGLVLSLGAAPAVTWAILVLPVVPAVLLLDRYVTPRLDARANRA